MTRTGPPRRAAHRPPPSRPAPVPFQGRPAGRRASLWRVGAVVFRAEVLAFLRDKRALGAAILLPVLLYPLMFFGNTWLEKVSRETLAARKVTVALDLAGAEPELAGELRRLLEDEPPIDLVDFDASTLREHALGRIDGRIDSLEAELRVARSELEGGFDLLITALPHSVLVDRMVFRLHHDGSNDLSNEASRRGRSALAELERNRAETLREEVLVAGDPARGLDEVSVDVASPDDSGGAALGKLLPLVAMLVLVSGGAYGALSAFAGERENNTLETLLVQPVPALAVAWGKFAAVALLAVAALLSNAGSLIGSLAFGLGRLPGMEEGSTAVVLSAGRLALGAVVFLPAALLICAVLCLISARAQSFREGQHAIFPLTLVVALPAAAAGWGDVGLDAFTAAVPLLGPSLALRDVMAGRLAAVPALVAFVSGCVWAAFALARMASTLDAERLLQSAETEHEYGQRRSASRTAIAFGLFAVLAIYVVGGWLQSRQILWGMLATLWLVVPVLTLLAARAIARRTKTPLRELMSLRAPKPAHALAALSLAPALAWFMSEWVPWQEKLLPMPSSALTGSPVVALLADLSPWAVFLVFAASAGIHEELLFRGAILGGLVRDLSARRVVLWQAVLFALAHASIYRFVPTAVVGAVLALLVLRTRSVFAAMLLHTAYNGLLVLGGTYPVLADPRWSWLAIPGLLLLAWPAPRDGNAPPR